MYRNMVELSVLLAVLCVPGKQTEWGGSFPLGFVSEILLLSSLVARLSAWEANHLDFQLMSFDIVGFCSPLAAEEMCVIQEA